MKTKLEILDTFAEYGFVRKEPVLVVVGGGVLTDVAGYACASYRRTSNFIRIPTTLIGLIDASVSIKVGLNHGHIRNGFTELIDGIAVTLDIDDKYIRPDIWKKAGIDKKIELRIKPAVDSLNDLLNEYGENSFDFIFIDGDKPNYINYYDLSLRLLRPNGLIAIDNTIYTGFIVDPTKIDLNTITIRALNDKIKLDQTVDVCQLRLGDGTTFVRNK